MALKVGDKVKVKNVHDKGHKTGVVALISDEKPLGITIDGMESMGVHKWYVESELEKVTSDAKDDTKSKGDKPKGGHSSMNMRSDEPDGETPSDIELRWAPDAELRAVDDQARRLSGYAATFNNPTKIRSWSGEFDEVISTGAFGETLRSGADVRLLVEHDPRSLLARTSAGNLTLTEDGKGLRFEVTLPDTQLGRDTYEQVRVGNYKGMSFGFRPVKTRTQYDDKGRLRSVTLDSVELREVTITSMPAYPKTSVAMRSLFTRSEIPADALSLRLRLAKLRG